MAGFYHTVARYYDAENADKTDDIEFYLELAEEFGGPILDVGCGTGRVVLPLAQHGYTVYGVDNEAAMLQRAQARVARQPNAFKTLTLHQGDIHEYAPGVQFKLVLLTYNMLMHFHEPDEQLALLRRLRDLLTDDGLLVLDLPNAGETYAAPDTDALTLERTFVDPDTGHMVMQQAHSQLDRAEQFLRVLWVYDEIDGDGHITRTVAPNVFRYFFQHEVRLLLRLAGFDVEEVYGDTDRSPYGDGAPRMIVVAVPE